MKQHEREYFISRIRTGFYLVKIDGISLKIVTPTIDQEYELNEIYQEAYEQALDDEFMTEEDMKYWMFEKDLWTPYDDREIEKVKKDIEDFKIEIFNIRNNERSKNLTRSKLRSAEQTLSKLFERKNAYQTNTCEGIAFLEKTFAFLKKCTYLNNELFDFEYVSIDTVLSSYYLSILDESKIRDIARNEPWRTLWILNNKDHKVLFSNTQRELSIDQRNLLVWSRTYDTVHESMDCPSDEVINDDDMLDGWFVIQKRKRETKQLESEAEDLIKNSKVKNSNEVYLMAGSKDDAKKINQLNDTSSKVIKKERFAKIEQSQSPISQSALPDEKLKIMNKTAQQFKEKFRR